MTLKQKKRIAYAAVAVFLAAGIAVLLWQSLRGQAREEPLAVTLSVNCAAVLGHEDALEPAVREGGYLPEDGVLLQKRTYHMAQGATVFDLLQKACTQAGIPLEYNGSGALKTVYVEGIGYLYEFSCGETSGWVYRVNGKVESVGCAGRALRDGDQVEWVYTLDLGRDAGYTGGLDDAA